jgi:hypothetical protein
VILFFRFLAWTANYEPSHPMLFVLAGVFSAVLFVAFCTVGVYIDHEQSSSKH